MEDTFRVRVDRAFGSLSFSSPSSSSSSSSSSQPLRSSLWCLSDEEIEKRSWSRESASLADAAVGEPNNTDDDDDDDCPFPSGVDRLLSAIKGKLAPGDENLNPNPNSNPNPNPRELREELENDLQELDDDDDDDASEGTSGGGSEGGFSSSTSWPRETVNDEDEELDVRNSIGMDCTLDSEEEEDEYDKVAVGREKSGDRLYMSDITDYMPDFYSNDEIPGSFKEVSRDPRANHLAAKLRLKEDAETARSFNSLQVSEPNETVVADTQNNTPENGNSLKSILKRKEHQMGSKSEKRVRFEPSCKNSDEESGGEKNVAPEPSSNGEIMLHEGASSKNRDSSFVPDYMRNPSRYTHYTFDSSTDMNDESNRQAYMDFLNIIKKPKQSDPEEVPADLSKPMIFNPKKKASQGLIASASNETGLTKEMTMDEPLSKKNMPVSFAFWSMQEDEASEMEVDEQVTEMTKVGNGQRTRRYRSKVGLESNE